MRDRFQQEIVALAGGRVRVEVVRSGGKFGSPQYEVRLYANPKAKVHDVLSEGEQTCVALASYLTELANASHTSALVFDDPVSSLDHRWRSKVAKRLAKEAVVRQVIIFTHDMIFVNDLAQLASEQNTPIALAHLTRGQDVVGIVNKDLPWTASSIRDRIDKLEKAAREASKLFGKNDDEGYKAEVTSIYSRLRATWERALEDIVFANVLIRHRDYIDTKNLKRVTALE
jgi:ABC-type multidrug transport system ATPase subunit